MFFEQRHPTKQPVTIDQVRAENNFKKVVMPQILLAESMSMYFQKVSLMS